MKFISHRGNINGKNDLENHPDQIIAAVENGYDVEIDVRVVEDKIYLGHDRADYEIDINFLINFIDKLWIHIKNDKAIEFFLKSEIKFNYFWHQNDDYTLTSLGNLWTFPGKILINDFSISVLPEMEKSNLDNIFSCYGICSDIIEYYKESYGNLNK